MSYETVIAKLEVRLEHLQIQLEDAYKDSVKELENIRRDYNARLEALEAKNDELESRIRLGKGIFLGVIFTLGTFGVIAIDKISNLIKSINKLL